MAKRVNLLQELWLFLRENKKWWLWPILIIMALFAVLIIFSSSPIAPFIYTLF